MEELEQGKGKQFDSAEELFEDLGLRNAEAGSVQQLQTRLKKN